MVENFNVSGGDFRKCQNVNCVWEQVKQLSSFNI